MSKLLIEHLFIALAIFQRWNSFTQLPLNGSDEKVEWYLEVGSLDRAQRKLLNLAVELQGSYAAASMWLHTDSC